MNLYWGDMHNHCGISYGMGSLRNALCVARTHLDFCCVTGHAMWPDICPRCEETAFVVDYHIRGFEKLQKGWQAVLGTVNAFNTEDLVTFQSYEMHHSHLGDHHIISPDPDLPLIYRDTPTELVRDCGRRAIAIPHHIAYTPGYRGICWDAFDRSVSPFVEVVSKHGCAMREDGPLPYYHDMGPLDPRNTVAEGLRRGCRFSFAGSTDHHAGFPGAYGDGLTGVLAEGKNREALWDALCKGHVYAVTSDRIACRFTLNDAIMGDLTSTGSRAVRLWAEGDAPIEFMVIRKNGRIVASIVPSVAWKEPASDRIKLRVEMGWGSEQRKYHWDGTLRIDQGEIVCVKPYLRGVDAISPKDFDEKASDEINQVDDGYEVCGNEVHFRCDTIPNKTARHPQTCAFLFEVRAELGSYVTITVNGQTHTHTIKELLQCGYSFQMKQWNSQAVKVHTAYTAHQCQAELAFEDVAEGSMDYYEAEVVQSNGSRAFISPIFVAN